MKFVPESMTRNLGRQVLSMKKNSPHIFFGVGLLGVIGSTVLACRATLKLEDTLDEIKEELDEVAKTPASSETEHTKDVAYVYVKSAVKLGKLYGPSLVVGGISIASLTGSHVQLTKRNTALTVTLAAVSKAFDDYRVRVQEELGLDKERDIRHGVVQKEIEEDGKKKTVDVVDPDGLSPYARFFDEYSHQWTKNSEYNRYFLQSQQAHWNNRLRANGYVFLNEVYEALGFERSSAGQIVGWVYGEEGLDNHIDFGLFEVRNDRFINQLERSVLLDFNVDGVIYNKIERKKS